MFSRKKEKTKRLNFKSAKVISLLLQICLGDGDRNWFVGLEPSACKEQAVLGVEIIIHCTERESLWSLMHGMYFSFVAGLTLKASMKGCTTASECRNVAGGKNSLGALDIMFKRFECKPASVMAIVSSGFTPLHTFFLPVLLGFVLEEVLF